MEKANNSRFLGALGFGGFLGFLGFVPSKSYQHLAKLAYLSLLSLASLFVLISVEKSKVKVPVGPKRKGYLICLGFLGFLGFLASSNPGFAGLACMAAWSGLAVGSQTTTEATSNKTDAGDS